MPSPTRHARFASTRWSIVLAAKGANVSSRKALAELAQSYWPPLYAFVRRQGRSVPEAEDLTQGFFATLIEKGFLQSVDPAKGRFRSFLLAAMKHYVANEWAKAHALKRGGGVRVVAIDALGEEQRHPLEPADPQTPERIFERRWALAVLEQVMASLRKEYEQKGKGKLFEALKATLEGGDLSHREIGQGLGITESATRMAAHRLRERYRERLREEIAQTVADAADVEEEIRHLLNSL